MLGHEIDGFRRDLVRRHGQVAFILAIFIVDDTLGALQDVAAAWGFWHLSQFATDYRRMFGMRPSEALRESAKAFPLERLLVETDSPYLAPVPFRGKKCEPRMVKQTGLFLAQLKGLDPAEVARVTSENARRIFRI